MAMTSLDIGIACDLRSDFDSAQGVPVDALEEYDSRATVDAIAAALESLGHRPRRLGGGRRLIEALLAQPPQLVFNIAEGRGSRNREAQVPAVCEMLGVPCTHSDPLTLALALDKAMSKQILRAAGIRTAAFAVASSIEQARRVDLPFPLFVKPVAEGSSMGVRVDSRVDDMPALLRQVERCLRDYRQPVLIECYLPGVEVTVGVCGADEDARVIGAMEIAPVRVGTGEFIYGLEAKRNYLEDVRYHAPPLTLDERQRTDAEASALAACRALGCRDIARVDLRFDAAGEANLVEVNPIPGLNPVSSDLVIMNGLLGRSYQALIGLILDAALKRLSVAGSSAIASRQMLTWP